MNLTYIQQDKISKQLLSHRQTHYQTVKQSIKPRSAFPHRLRQESLPPNISKTISARADPLSPFEPQQVSLSLAKFDRMQLQDFLKVVIVGQQKVSEDKSKEIICSLNGTWFKNTNSDRPACKFYNNIGIKKHRNAKTTRKLDLNPILDPSLLIQDYSPNGFPLRKHSPRKTTQSRIVLLEPKNNMVSQKELAGTILQKIIKGKQSKRSHSTYLSRDVTSKTAELGEAVLKGRRMIIHD